MNSRKSIKIRELEIGGAAPVSVQSMCNTKTWDVEATVGQINAFKAAGCDIVRIAIPDMKSAQAVSEIREKTDMPLVADIHFDYRLALEAAERGIDKIRINPGNIGGSENVKKVADACRKRNIPIRIGVNAGSLEKTLLEKYGHPCPEAMAESAEGHIKLLNRYDPLHLGVTETGTSWNGTIQSAVGIGTLLNEGIGDTIRVSLTADPVEEVKAGIAILKACGLRKNGVRFISCPTCGRTEIDLISLADEVEEKLKDISKDITVAVMGCVVNGPGEAREADFGIAGGVGKGILFKKGEVLGTYPYSELSSRLMDLINGTED